MCREDAAFLRSPRPPYEALRPRVRVVDLFSGCGGLTIGVAEAARRLGLGIDVRLAVDLDGDAIRVYENNLPGADVRQVPVEQLFDGRVGSSLTSMERTVRKEVGEVDVLVGGPPCQGHSDLNNHTRRDDPRNALYARMARASEVLRPKLLLIENVPKVTRDVGKVVEGTAEALLQAGYAVAESVIDIAALGAPQRRRRHVLLATDREDVKIQDIVSRLADRCSDHPVRTVRWAIEDLKGAQAKRSFDLASAPSDENRERIAWLFEHRAYDLPNAQRPECHQSQHTYNSMYGRLRWDRPAQTVTTGFGSMGQGRYVHPSRRRTLTPHEAARLQMLPDFWTFDSVASRGALARLIGNAVPPVLATSLIQPTLSSLGFGPVEPEPASSRVSRTMAKAGPHRTDGQRPRRRTGPPASSAEASNRMKSIRQRDTAPELALRSALDRHGLSYLVHHRVDGVRGLPDIVFVSTRVVVNIDGCYWHGCPMHATSPKANKRWWASKLADNRRRDEETNFRLREAGWTVLRFWEHEDPSVAAAMVVNVVGPGASMNGASGGRHRQAVAGRRTRGSE